MGAPITTDFVLASNGDCFFCLSQLRELNPEKEVAASPPTQTHSLQYLTRYLKVDLRKVFLDWGQVSPELLNHVEKARLHVELCEECRCMSERFSKIYRQLEKLELELGSTLALIHEKLASAAATDKLRGLYSYSGLNPNWNRSLEVVVDVLRAEATQKSSRRLSETPRVKIQHLTKIEIKAKQSSLQSTEESVQMATNVEDVLQPGLVTNAVKIESPAEDGLSGIDNGNYFSEDFNSNIYSEPMHGYMKIERDLNGDDNILPQGQDMTIGNKKVISQPKRNLAVNSQCSIDLETGKRKCNHCSKQFNSLRAFTLHYQSNHLRLRYKCVSCNKLFSQKNSLGLHQRTSRSCSVAKSATNFKCHLCEKSFTQKINLQNHLEGAHYKLQKYACDFCGKKFNVTYGLARHKRKLHNIYAKR